MDVFSSGRDPYGEPGVKTRSEIIRRLRTLSYRYVKRSVATSQERRHLNCVYNQSFHRLNRDEPARSMDPDPSKMAPTHSVTLVVIQPEAPTRLCAYGIDKPESWAGDICDRDDTARACPKFKPLKDGAEAKAEAEAKLADDNWVLANMKDIAALQWVLGDRVHKVGLSWYQRILLWFQSRNVRVEPPEESELPLLPDSTLEGFWDKHDDSTHDSGA